MKLITWNVRGFNKVYKQVELAKFIRKNNVGVLALLEHRVQEIYVAGIIRKVAPGWHWCSNYNTSEKARISIIWNSNEFEFTEIINHT